MFERYTERARRVLFFARYEASQLGSISIETEHLLLGLIREGKGLTSRIFARSHLSLESIRKEIEGRTVFREKVSTSVEIPFSAETKRVLQFAAEEADRLLHNYIGTEHLLLGLVREGEGIAAGVLESLGVNLDKVRHQVIHVLSQSSSAAPAPETKRPSKTPTLDQLGINLTDLARADKLDPVIGREKEIERVIQILSRRTKNNPALIGEPGVGKTAIAEGLAHRIVSGDVPETLADKRVLTLDIGSLVAGTKYRGEVPAVLLERLVLVLGVLAGDPVRAAHLAHARQQVVLGDAELLGEAEQEVLDGEVLVTELGLGRLCGGHHRRQLARQPRFGSAVGLGELGHGLVGGVADPPVVDADLLENRQGDAAVGLAQDGGQEVVGGHLGVVERLGLLDRSGERLLGLQGPLVRVERHVDSLLPTQKS